MISIYSKFLHKIDICVAPLIMIKIYDNPSQSKTTTTLVVKQIET